MRRIVVLGLIILTTLIAIGTGYWAWFNCFSPRAEALKLVKMSLSDPNSAIFQRVKYHPKSRATCGYVNARNRLGGYVGPTQFLVLRDDTVMFEPKGSGDDEPVTEAGLKARIKALKKQRAFLNKVVKNCPNN